MKPGEHPEFFRFPAPEGRSRESTIVLDAEGVFFHDGERVEHPKLAAAMHTWISRHPDDGRYILTNGYDWTYFTVTDAPFFVRSIHGVPEGDPERCEAIALRLSDGSEEAWRVDRTRVGESGALYTEVKADDPRGPFEAKFSRHAQAALAPYLVELPEPPEPDRRPEASAPETDAPDAPQATAKAAEAHGSAALGIRLRGGTIRVGPGPAMR